MLGFSKGIRQSSELLTESVENIAFAGFRSRLTEGMRTPGLLRKHDSIENHFRSDEPDWAFGSVIRCSIAKLDHASGNYLKSGEVISASAHRKRGSDWIGNCMQKFLADLPPRLRIIVLLSNDDAYVQACFERVSRLHPMIERINDVAYGDGRVLWLHVVHFGGPGVNHIRSWLEAQTNKQGRKRDLVVAAVSGHLKKGILAVDRELPSSMA